MKLLRVVIAVLVIAFIASKCSTPSSISAPTPPQTQAAAQAAPAKPTTWIYGSYEDKMTGDKGSYSYVKSENTAEFEFPYQGKQHADLTVGSSGIVSFEIEKGQFTCGRGCYVLIKFDDEKPTRYEFQEFGDKNDNIISFDQKLLNKIMHANHMTARLYFFQNDSVDFEFKVEGLKRPDLESKGKKKT
ncbi:MAG: hypothetical protein ACXWC4_03835 [Telluria sp.]